MPRETMLLRAAARLARLPFWVLARKRPVEPRKALILKPCCISQVMLTTPLLSLLAERFPEARFDWAVSDWARPAVAGNPQVAQLISTGSGSIDQLTWHEVGELVRRIRIEAYDTCFVPSPSSILAFIAWRAGIPQRVGLNGGGRGFAHTAAIKVAKARVHTSERHLALSSAFLPNLSRPESISMSFYPSDADRSLVTQRLQDELNWMGKRPLVIIHPGGGRSPRRNDPQVRWPAERFALLVNHIVRKHRASILLVGDKADRTLAEEISGLMSGTPANWAASLTLGEVGALCEVASLYIGNDAGPTHVAAAVDCPTVAIFGPTDPRLSGPIGSKEKLSVLWRVAEGNHAFSWADGVSLEEAVIAVDSLLTDEK